MDAKEFGVYFSRLRENAGFNSQASLARASGVWNSTIARIESGQTTNPDPQTLRKLAPFLNVDYEELLKNAGYLTQVENRSLNLDYIKKTFSERMLRHREIAGFSKEDLAEILNIEVQEINDYEAGLKLPELNTLNKLSDIFKIQKEYLIGLTSASAYFEASEIIELENRLSLIYPNEQINTNYFPHEDCIKLPVIGIVKAGPNGLVYQETLGEEFAEKKSINGGHYFWLKIKGDSMINEGILPGDLALVREQPEIEDGELAIIIINNEEGTIKRVYKSENSIVLHSANPSYPPRIFSGNELANIRIVGKVKEIKRKF